MITAQLVSPWAVTPAPTEGRHPKIQDDYTLESCRTAESRPSATSFADPASQRVVQSPPGPCVPVVIRCEHDIWEAIIHDPEYGPVYWYQEDGRQKRILS